MDSFAFYLFFFLIILVVYIFYIFTVLYNDYKYTNNSPGMFMWIFTIILSIEFLPYLAIVLFYESKDRFCFLLFNLLNILILSL